SRWKDVTESRPWGNGCAGGTPLIPYRVLAVSKKDRPRLCHKAYIRALDGFRIPPFGEIHNGICVLGACGRMDPGMQFDFFKCLGSMKLPIKDGLPSFRNSKGTTLPQSNIAFLEECKPAADYHAKRRKK